MSVSSNRVIRNTGYLFFRLVVTMFMSLWVTRIVLKTLGVSDFGLYNTIGWAIGMLGFISESMSSVTQRYMSYYQGAGDERRCFEIYNVSLIIHFVLAIILVIALVVAGVIFFSGLLNIPEGRMFAAKIIYVAMTISTAFTLMTVPYEAIITAHENMFFFAVEGIIRSCVKLIVACSVLYIDGDKLVVYGILLSIVSILDMLILRYYCHITYKECVFSPSHYWNNSIAIEMTKFASWNFFKSVSAFITNYGSVLVLNHFFGVILNAAAGIASQFGGCLQTFSSSMKKALDPSITKSEGEGNREKMLKYSSSGCKFTFATFAILAIPIYIEMPFVLHLWLGQYPAWSVIFSRMILVWTLISILTLPYEQALLSEGHISNFSLVTSIINVLPLVVLVFMFMNGFPPITMYILNILLLGVVQSIIRVVFAHKKCGLSYKSFLSDVLNPIIITMLASLLVSIIPYLFMEESYIRLLLTLFVSTVSYSTLFWLYVIDEDERTVINYAFSKIVNRFL